MLSDAAESITKTSKAVAVLKKIGALPDVEKSKESKAVRAGKGRLTDLLVGTSRVLILRAAAQARCAIAATR